MKQTPSPSASPVARATDADPHPHARQLTPQMRGLIDRMARAGHAPFYALPPEEAQAAYEKGANVLEVPKAALARIEDFSLPSRDGATLPARLYSARERTAQLQPMLLYFHGGGFTIGSIATHDILCRELARLSGAMVVSLDYRRAPAHRFPTAVNDCEDAMRWLAREAATLGGNASRLALAGDSAGGTLAAVCAILARDAQLPIALQLLVYPGTTAHADTPSHAAYAEGLILDAPSIAYFFDQYIPDHAQRDDWRFAPLNADDLEGVAPAWIGLAELDPLFDEGIAYADKLRASGVAVDLEVYRGVTHEFIKLGRAIPEARQAHADMARALVTALGLDDPKESLS